LTSPARPLPTCPHAEDTLFQRFGKEFPKGTVLFHEGETGKEMFVLQAGKVVITKTVRDTVKTLATLGPGEFFGEMALISNRPRTPPPPWRSRRGSWSSTPRPSRG
jgi:hypothetical protein